MRQQRKELRLSVEGVSAEEIERANAAARAVFEDAGADPWVAAVAQFKLEGAMEFDLDGGIDGLTDEECELATLWDTAFLQAGVACYGSEENYYNSPHDFDYELVTLRRRCDYRSEPICPDHPGQQGLF